MNGTLISAGEQRRKRTRRLDRVRAARASLHELEPRPRDSRGAAWINGRRVGGSPRYDHLYETYD